MMKVVSIDKNLCIGCGMCAAIADAIFALEDDGLASVRIPDGKLDTKEKEGLAEEAKSSCPTAAILIEEK